MDSQSIPTRTEQDKNHSKFLDNAVVASAPPVVYNA